MAHSDDVDTVRAWYGMDGRADGIAQAPIIYMIRAFF